jgi:hypothetical protein
MALLGSRRVTDLELTLPPAGGWLGTLHLDSGEPPSPGPTVLTIGDLALTCAILPGRGGADSPAHPAVVVAGGAGWRTPLPAPGASLVSPTGVRLSTILAALAGVSHELYDAPPEVIVSPAVGGTPGTYGWDASTPRRPVRCRAILADLVERGALPTWRVQPNGRTSFAPWPALGPADRFGVVEGRGLAFGGRTVALATTVSPWLPGATVQGVTIARVTYREQGGELRATVWSS